MRLACLCFLLLASPVSAHEWPTTDQRYRTVQYDGRSTYSVSASPDTNQLLLFAQDERIQSVILSDPNAYYVSVSGSGDSLAFKAVNRSSLALMSVQTDQRSYHIELTAGRAGPVPEVIRFAYTIEGAEPQRPAVPPKMLETVSYRLSGSKELRPASINDDGQKTYIAWRDNQAMPAIFAIGPSGNEQMVDGYVRAGLFTIDRTYEEFVFRIDRRSAKARRVVKKERKKK